METELQRRYLAIGSTPGVEIRAEGEGELPTIHGVACPWNSLSVELWRDWVTGKPVYEQFAPGAFRAVLAGEPDIVVLRDHDRSRLLGRTSSGTAKVFETDRGLEYEFVPPPIEEGRAIVALIRRGDIAGSSFAFFDKKVTYDEQPKRIVRTVEEVSALEDVSPVTRPAYPKSKVAERSIESLQRQLDEWRGTKYSDQWYEEELARLMAAGL